MITFEGEYKNLKARIFSEKTFAFLFVFIFYSFILSHFFKDENLKYYAYFLEFALLILCIALAVNTFKSIINVVTIDENKVILEGEVFNNKWEKSIPLKGTRIEVKGNASRSGLSGVTFYINLKNKKNKYNINSFQTFSDEQIIEIFNEFKKYKGEKIIIDERLYIMRIHEKIEKCQ
ncbi:hypothetical protein [Flavobacterium sp. KACC 22761]|uniref:hypothetical protein n=1 Tax=Flavobacterium sp. KACC 22761 TaxID=3092665 RepID=UPI002A76168B|nr:hypothetical protein [Flavobacterium sp. KACC 22761]WPO77635.1 hypothetical protein SCB73_15300 [Flavobacterium sp. KACC 22761]